MKTTTHRRKSMTALIAGMAALVITGLLTFAGSTSAAVQNHGSSAMSLANLGPEQAAQYPITRIIPLTVPTTCGNDRQTVEGPTADGISAVGCISPSVASVVAPQVASLAASFCTQNAVVHSRHASCGVATIDYKVIHLPSKKVLGTGTVLVLY
jgi:hypothetical protein